MKALTIVLILVLVFGSLFSLAVSIVGNHAIDAMTEKAGNPSATDIIMKSRQTPAETADRSSAAWLGAGLLAIALVSMGAAVFVMRGGTDLLKQWRLAQKRPMHRRPVQPIPQVPYSPHLREVPNVPPTRRLTEVRDYEQGLDYTG